MPSYRIAFLMAVLLLAAAAPPAQAGVFIPTKLTDGADGACDSDCSLRDAILAANAAAGPDFVVLGAGTYSLSLAGAGEDLGATGDLDVSDDLAIVGRDAAGTVIDANQIDRAFDVLAGARLELVSLTVADGLVSSGIAGNGGGIRVTGELDLTRAVVRASQAGQGGGIAALGEAAVLNVDQSSILQNRSTGQGGGIYLEGTIHMVNSTVWGNVAELTGGGGLYAEEDAAGTVSNSTFYQNQAASGRGGGVHVASEPFISVDHPVFENTIIAGSSSSTATEKDCFGAALSAGHNLLGEGSGCLDFGPHPGDLEGTLAAPLDPKLLPFEDTGGPTPVLRPASGSPAINHGADCEPVDQRGAARSAAACEIGAVEVTGQCISGGPILCLNKSRFQVQVTWMTTVGTGSGPGQAIQLTDESGFFTFFDPSNVEMTVKVLNGCGLGGHYWVFLGGLTDVGVKVTVTDTKTGAVKTYTNPLFKRFEPVFDTSAFATCP
ncbi:MAG TPA: choice-of-anchor Q domain-containing protein [Thermoanaerobaculia bacterium]|nr:choice-of-anchor Q domain-containing protein [Thermoanaerobaculia bacterium]